jgi:hypothetical protein
MMLLGAVISAVNDLYSQTFSRAGKVASKLSNHLTSNKVGYPILVQSAYLLAVYLVAKLAMVSRSSIHL